MSFRDQVTDYTRPLPKVISPGVHAILDYVTAGTFFVVGALFWRRNRRAALAAWINGGAVLGASLMTDYPGGISPVFSFETHAKIDVAQAGMAAGMPALLGFGAEPEAAFFYGQAATETAVIGMTDWESGTSDAETRLRRAA